MFILSDRIDWNPHERGTTLKWDGIRASKPRSDELQLAMTARTTQQENTDTTIRTKRRPVF